MPTLEADQTTLGNKEDWFTLQAQVAELSDKLDMLGRQMNWLCENMQGLFSFVNEMGTSGGGIRGMVHTLKKMQGLQLNDQLMADLEREEP